MSEREDSPVDLVARQSHERVPPERKPAPEIVGAVGEKGATIDPELVRRFVDFRRSYKALEAYMRRLGMDL